MKYCTSIDSDLVSVHSKEEMDFLKNNILIGNNKNVWIGGFETDGKWSWVDKSEFDWHNWEETQPNGSKRADSISECTYLWRDLRYQWADAKCNSQKYPFVCKS